MSKFLQGLFHLIVIAASIGAAWLYWSGIFPERMKSGVSSTGMEMQLRITGTRGWNPEFKTMLSLHRMEGDRFVYDLQKLESREAVERVVASMRWIDGDTLRFSNYPKNKTVTISYRGGLWSLSEKKQ